MGKISDTWDFFFKYVVMGKELYTYLRTTIGEDAFCYECLDFQRKIYIFDRVSALLYQTH